MQNQHKHLFQEVSKALTALQQDKNSRCFIIVGNSADSTGALSVSMGTAGISSGELFATVCEALSYFFNDNIHRHQEN